MLAPAPMRMGPWDERLTRMACCWRPQYGRVAVLGICESMSARPGTGSECQDQFARAAMMDQGNHGDLKQGYRAEQHQDCGRALGPVGDLALMLCVWLFSVKDMSVWRAMG